MATPPEPAPLTRALNAFDLKDLREKFEGDAEFNWRKASDELQVLFTRFSRVNLEMEKLPRQDEETQRRFDKQEEDLLAQVAQVNNQLDELTESTKLALQGESSPKGSPQRKESRQQAYATNRRFKKAISEARYFSKRYNKSFDLFLRSIEHRQSRYNLYGWRFKRDSAGTTLVLHLVNTAVTDVEAQIHIAHFTATTAGVISISGALPAENTPENPRAFVPVEQTIRPDANGDLHYTCAPWSCTVIRTTYDK
jgi:hypothetical protein